jgi:hypothetical protein
MAAKKLDRQDLSTRRHEIYPSVVRKIIYKDNIVAMTPFRSEGSRTPKHRNEQGQKDT